MNHRNQADELMLKQLFNHFIDSGLHGRFEETVSLIDEPYIGVGMGEQGIVHNKAQVELVLRGGYCPADEESIKFEVKDFTVNFINDDVAILLGKVEITNIPENGEPMHSGLMQTVCARRRGEGWGIAFTHASPTIVTVESLEAYPIRFMDHTLSLLKAGLQAETVLYAEINLTQNSVVRLESKSQEWLGKPEAHTLEEAVGYGLRGQTDAHVEEEYQAFWNRLRLLGLFAEGVTKDHFDYRLSIGQSSFGLRAAVEMVRQTYSADVMAVITFSRLDGQKEDLEHFTHKAFHDALTGVLNREGFENKVAERLLNYDPQNNTALFMIDLDDFKQINDRLGHQMGDIVLQQVAAVLQKTFRGSDAVGRVGGDEFMVLFTGEFTSAFLEKKAEKLLNAMKLRMGGSKQIPVSVSIGVAYGRARATFEKLYRLADIALYTAKKAGKCRCQLINADTNTEQSYSGADANLLSLQTLLNNTAGKELVLSRTPYEALVENIPGSVLVISLTDRVRLTHCNDWTSRFTGYSREEIEEIQKNDALALIHPEDHAKIFDIIKQTYAGLEIVHIIYRLRRKDGTYGHVQINASMTERTKNEMIFHGIETDVGEVIQLKQEVEEAHSRLKMMINSMPGGVVIISLSDRVELTHCNSWISRFLGYELREVDEFEKNNVLTLVHPEDHPIVMDAVKQMKTGKENVTITYRLLGKDGDYRHVRINASMTERCSDKTIYYGVVTSVEEINYIQGKLEYSRKQLEALLSAIPGGIAIFEISDTLKVTQYGTWFSKYTGYDSEEEIERVRQGKQLSTVWPEDIERTQEELRRVCEDGIDNVFLSIRLICKDGTPKRTHIRGSVIERTPEKVTMYVIYTEPADFLKE